LRGPSSAEKRAAPGTFAGGCGARTGEKAPTLYAIIAIKLLKGLVLMALALGVYRLAGENLENRLGDLLRILHLDPDRDLFLNLGARLVQVTPANVRQVATIALLYSLFSFAEAAGLILRVRWVGWIVIGESLFFIPIEIYELIKRFSIGLSVILVINIVIVEYLYRNRNRVFRTHRPHPLPHSDHG
jgi:uncharacterized membrane protein (DUF2068 family)